MKQKYILKVTNGTYVKLLVLQIHRIQE